MKIMLFLLVFFSGLVIFLPTYVMMQEDFRSSFCHNHSVDNEDYNECFSTLEEQMLIHNMIGTFMMIGSLTAILVFYFPSNDFEVSERRTPV